MKTSLFVKVLAVFFAAFVSMFSLATAGEPARLSPPTESRIEKISVSSNKVDYRVVWGKENGAYFTTDSDGVLSQIVVVENDRTTVNMRKDSRIASGWVKEDRGGLKEIDIGAWSKYFTEKVAPVPVVIEPSHGAVTLEKEFGEGVQWELIGESYGSQRERFINIRKIGTDYMRSLRHDEFSLPPPDKRPFLMGVMDGKFCAVEKVVPSEGSAPVTVVAVRTY